MAKKLVALRNVPDDEADELRQLLRDNDIDFHETTAGFTGLGTAAIWINDASQVDAAKALFKAYQAQRYEHAREEYLARKLAGDNASFLDICRDSPGKISLYFAVALLLLGLTTLPFWL
jgi:hypothetical protein